jgi:phosphoribosyl 1,2-cyclic phosphodiesterase
LVEVLLSHLHLDHIMGAPFFEPFYRADAQVTLHCGLFDDAEAFAARMKGLIAPPWFPVEPLKMAAARFAALPVRAPFEAAGFTVTAVPLHHPGGCMGFRIEGPDWSVAIIGDHEHGRPDTDAAARDLAVRLDSVVGTNAPQINAFMQAGLPQFVRFMQEGRSLMENLQRVTEKLERDPARFLLGTQRPEFRR